MTREYRATAQKALEINLDPSIYGTFAEIGAGQEVARWFFHVGGAAGTVAKSMSAYDMTISDAIYGQSDRYVSRRRLQTMLDYEYKLLIDRLYDKRGETSRFFVFADTVAASSYKHASEGQGWMGIKFQHMPRALPSQIMMHVRMLDKPNIDQQEALGVIGVNLIHGAMYLHDKPETLISTLLSDLSAERIQVDMIKFAGPLFQHLDNRLMALQLVQQGLSLAAMFTPEGETVQVGDALYHKALIVERGSFRPLTHIHLDMQQRALAQVKAENRDLSENEIVPIMELTLKNLLSNGDMDHKDFLARADSIGAMGYNTLISNYSEYFRLTAYLSSQTKNPINFLLGIKVLREIFDEKYYTNLDGGILESFGRLFKNSVRLWIYPEIDLETGKVVTVDNFEVEPHLKDLYTYLRSSRYILGIEGVDAEILKIKAPIVLGKIQSGDLSWKKDVPPPVAELIESKQLFGFKQG
jgi:hypothetical protein